MDAFIMVPPVAMFVASGFEHSIANMFMRFLWHCNTRFRYTGVLDRQSPESCSTVDEPSPKGHDRLVGAAVC